MDKRTLNELMAWADYEEQRVYDNYGTRAYGRGYADALFSLRAKLNEMPVTK